MIVEGDGPGVVTLGAEDRAAAVAEVRQYLRSADSDEDDLIAALAETALGLAERYTGQLWLARAMTEAVAASRYWTPLRAGPVRAITAVAALDTAGDEVAIAAEAHAIDIDANGTGWVRLRAPVTASRVVVTIEGWGADSWGAIPDGIRQGAVLLAAHLFDAREADAAPPLAVAALWRPFRRMRLFERHA